MPTLDAVILATRRKATLCQMVTTDKSFNAEEMRDLGAFFEDVAIKLEDCRTAMDDLIQNANRLCDRSLGGTYEDDCRQSLERARRVLVP